MIFFDVRLDNQPTATVSIRKMSLPAQGFGQVWAYEVTSTAKKIKHRGTVEHEGPEDFALIATVLNDFVGSNEQ